MRRGGYPVFGGMFTPRLGPALFTFFGVIVLLGLGVWQLQRMEWKHALIRKIEARVHGTAMPLPQDFAEPDAFDYRRVWVTGTFRHDKEMYLLARDTFGRSGFHVLTPMITGGGQAVLIDRGFVPSDKRLPRTRPEGQLDGAVTITGVARIPPKPGWMTPDNRPDENLWFWIDTKPMASFTGVRSLQPVIIDADSTPNPGGYPIGGQTTLRFTDNHFVYAMTWFGLAIALAVIFFLAHWKK